MEAAAAAPENGRQAAVASTPHHHRLVPSPPLGPNPASGRSRNHHQTVASPSSLHHRPAPPRSTSPHQADPRPTPLPPPSPSIDLPFSPTKIPPPPEPPCLHSHLASKQLRSRPSFPLLPRPHHQSQSLFPHHSNTPHDRHHLQSQLLISTSCFNPVPAAHSSLAIAVHPQTASTPSSFDATFYRVSTKAIVTSTAAKQ